MHHVREREEEFTFHMVQPQAYCISTSWCKPILTSSIYNNDNNDNNDDDIDDNDEFNSLQL